MKRFFITLGMMVAATLSLTNCNKENAEVVLPASNEFTIVASEIETKTTNDGMNTKWSANDSVAVFHAVAGTSDYVFDGKFVTAEGDGKFTGTLTSALDAGKSYDWYMIYPYNSKFTTPANTTTYSYIGNRAKGLSQAGNDSMSHVCGSSFTLVGKTSAVAAAEVPSLQMKNVASLAAIKVTNSTSSPITVAKVTLDAGVDIVGSYYVNFADIDNVTLLPSEGYVVNTSVVEVKNAEPIPAGQSATYYAAVKPFTAAAGSSIKVKVEATSGSFEKTIDVTAPATFAAGKVKTVNVPVTSLTAAAAQTLSDVTGPGNYTIRNVTVMAVNGSAVIVKDATGLGYIFKSGHGLKVMDVADIIDGTVVMYNEVPEFNAGTFTKTGSVETLDHGTALEYDMAAQTAFAAAPCVKYAHVIGTLDADKGRTVTTADGAAVYLAAAVTALKGKSVEVYGYLDGWSAKNTNANLLQISVDEYVNPNAPVFGVEKETVTVDANATTATIKVTGNVAWEATALSDGLTVTPTSGTGEATITATFPANTASSSVEYTVSVETSAAVTPSEYEITIKQGAYVPAGVDVLSQGTIGYEAQSSYTEWTYTGQTGAKYSGNSAGSNSTVQLRANSGSGIVTTQSSGAVTSVNVDWRVTEGDVVRKIEIYGKNTPYTSTADLSNPVNKGTLVGSIQQGVSTSLDFATKYKYIAIKATDGTVYINEIRISWGDDSGIEVKQNQALSFAAATATATVGAAFTAPALSGANTTVTYASSNTSVATVDAATGAVTLVAPGSTVISAVAAEDATYYAAYAEYELTVNAQDGSKTVSFTTLGFASWGKQASFSGNTYDEVSQAKDGVTFTYTKNAGSCYANTNAIRFYKANTLKFDAPAGYQITSIVWTGSGFKGDVTTDVPTCTSSTSGLSWTGDATSVTFTRPADATSYETLSGVSITIEKK